MKEINTIIQGIKEIDTKTKDLISKITLSQSVIILLITLFGYKVAYKAGHALGEFIYYLGQS